MSAAVRLLLLLMLALPAGCAFTDPYQREGNWRPNDANDANLQAMVSTPSQLLVAAQPDDASGQQAAAALDRLRHDKVRRLPDSVIARGVAGGAAAPGTGN